MVKKNSMWNIRGTYDKSTVKACLMMLRLCLNDDGTVDTRKLMDGIKELELDIYYEDKNYD